MKIAIADDLETDRNVIKDMVLDFFGRLQIKADITTYESAEALLNDFKPHSFDLILLDIYGNSQWYRCCEGNIQRR